MRLWLPREDSCILIQLAEIQWVKDYWIKAEFIKVSPNNQARIERLLALETHPTRQFIALRDQILVRA